MSRDREHEDRLAGTEADTVTAGTSTSSVGGTAIGDEPAVGAGEGEGEGGGQGGGRGGGRSPLDEVAERAERTAWGRPGSGRRQSDDHRDGDEVG
jgi:hypothetical protein